MAWTAFSIRRKSEAAEACDRALHSIYAGGWLHGTGSAAWNTGESSVAASLIPSAVWRFGMQRCMKLEHQYAVTLFNKGRERHVQAILDTGNHLTMPLSGRPVQVLDACAARDFFPGRTVSNTSHFGVSERAAA